MEVSRLKRKIIPLWNFSKKRKKGVIERLIPWRAFFVLTTTRFSFSSRDVRHLLLGSHAVSPKPCVGRSGCRSRFCRSIRISGSGGSFDRILHICLAFQRHVFLLGRKSVFVAVFALPFLGIFWSRLRFPGRNRAFFILSFWLLVLRVESLFPPQSRFSPTAALAMLCWC